MLEQEHCAKETMTLLIFGFALLVSAGFALVIVGLVDILAALNKILDKMP